MLELVGTEVLQKKAEARAKKVEARRKAVEDEQAREAEQAPPPEGKEQKEEKSKG